MKIWDISMTIERKMPVWKGRENKRPTITITRDFENGSGARETRLELDSHTGTHIDAPLHFVPGGRTIDEIPLDKLIRPVKVLDLTAVPDVIQSVHLDTQSIKPGDFVLLKTRNSMENIIEGEFVYISTSAAHRLVELGVEGVGIDALGVERDQADYGTHHALLEAGVIIIEGLCLGQVEQGEYRMIAAPLKVAGLEAALARVVLTELE